MRPPSFDGEVGYLRITQHFDMCRRKILLECLQYRDGEYEIPNGTSPDDQHLAFALDHNDGEVRKIVTPSKMINAQNAIRERQRIFNLPRSLVAH